MKKAIFKAALLAATVILHITGTSAQDDDAQKSMQEDTLSNGLLLSIDVTSNDLNLRDATIKIYHNNVFVAALNNKLQPQIKVSLEKNTYYVLEVNKPGYASKSILISTVMPEKFSTEGSDNTKYEHSVSISLVKMPLGSKCADPLIGILYYDAEKDVYVGSPMINEAEDKEKILVQLENWLGY
jgi:hypothetical protein